MGSIFLAFLAGLFFFNGIPHFVKGVCGQEHMTPFRRKSSPLLNVIWAWVNWGLGSLFLAASAPPSWELIHLAGFIMGALVISISLSIFWSNADARLPWHRD